MQNPKKLGKVIIRGNHVFSSQQILKLAKLDQSKLWSEVDIDQTIQLFDYALFENVVIRKIYPNIVHIIVKEKKPFLLWSFQKKFYVFDEQMQLLTILDQTKQATNLTIVAGASNKTPSKKIFQKVSQISKLLKAHAPDWEKAIIDISDMTNIKLIYPIAEISLGWGDYHSKILQLHQCGIKILKNSYRQMIKLDMRHVSKIYLSFGKTIYH